MFAIRRVDGLWYAPVPNLAHSDFDRRRIFTFITRIEAVDVRSHLEKQGHSNIKIVELNWQVVS